MTLPTHSPHPPRHHAPSLLRILVWFLLALVLGALAVVVDGCAATRLPKLQTPPRIGRPLPMPRADGGPRR
jgi:hypothetical protein